MSELRGSALIADVNACHPARRECAFWWLGQHSFILKAGDSILYLDPFLTALRGRRVAPLLRPEELAHAHLIFGSHDHADHIDRPAWPIIAKVAEAARFVVPSLLVDRLSRDLSIPVDRFLGVDDGLNVEAGAIRITGVAAAHEFLDADPRSGRFPYMGFVIQENGCTVYHSGDCCVYEGLQTKLKALRPDVLFLPINGRDAARLRRNCVGNMTYQEAADLAGALGPGLVVPSHFDMFEGNREDPELFRDYMSVKYPGVAVRVPRYGERCVAACRHTTE